MYFICDTSELLKGDILKRYQAYKTGLESNVLQIDEVRYKEYLPPLGINFIKLGLQDVLYDPKTKTIYTPNMNQSMTMSENKVNFGNDEVDNVGQDGIMEERFREDQARDERGRFASEGSLLGGIDETVSKGGFVRLPDGTVQPRQYFNGGGKLSEEDNRKNQESFEKDVASGRISTKLDKRAQAAHKKGSDAFNKRVANGEIPSYTTRKNMDVQTIINRHNNDGTLYLVNGQYKRVITEPEIVGMFGDRRTNTYLPTKRATIHYSQDGAHLVPAPPKED